MGRNLSNTNFFEVQCEMFSLGLKFSFEELNQKFVSNSKHGCFLFPNVAERITDDTDKLCFSLSDTSNLKVCSNMIVQPCPNLEISAKKLGKVCMFYA